MRVAVTGAAGFLGGAVVEAHKAAGFDVVALSRSESATPGVQHLRGDLTDNAYVRRALKGVAVVHHIAARVHPLGSMADYVRDNVEVTKTVLRAARDSGAESFVYCSSPSVVFDGTPIRGGDESLQRRPLSCSRYSVTKAQAEREVEAACAAADMRAIILRPHLIWGPGDRHLLPGLLNMVDRLRFLPRPRGIDPTIDPTHVTDAAQAHLRATDHVHRMAVGKCATYFISGPDRVSLWSAIDELVLAEAGRAVRSFDVPARVFLAAGAVAEGASRASRYRLPVSFCRFTARSMMQDQYFDISAARHDLGYEPLVHVADLRSVGRS